MPYNYQKYLSIGLNLQIRQYVHIDEKWFQLTEEQSRYYLEIDESQSHRQMKSKIFITEVATVIRTR